MARINKALFWSLFAAGGTLTAFVFPAIALVLLFTAYGHAPDIMAYEQMHGLLSNWLAKLGAFGIVALALWHAAHRMRTALHGIGLRADGLVAIVGYGIALLGTLLAAYFLLQI